MSDQELNRLETEFGINTTGTIEEFRQGLQNFYEGTKNDYDRFVTADQYAANKIDRPGYGNIQNTPKRIEQQRPDKPKVQGNPGQTKVNSMGWTVQLGQDGKWRRIK